MMTKTSPYGSWKSPITPELIVSSSLRLGEIVFDGEDIYWIEGRPAEQGRSAIMRRKPDGTTKDMLPIPFNARSQVHEYGGGAFTVGGEILYFVNFSDQRIYSRHKEEAPQPFTPESTRRYGNLLHNPHCNSLICVVEDHQEGLEEPKNYLAHIDLNSGLTFPLAAGNDFYASPTLSPDGKQLAWLTWNHPNMPWDGTELWLGDITECGKLRNARKIAGGNNESIFQPRFSPDGLLCYISDRSNWWNFYRWDGGNEEHLLDMPAEFGLPQWVFGMSTYAFLSADEILCTYKQNGVETLAIFNLNTKSLEKIETPYTGFYGIQTSNGLAACHTSSPQKSSAIQLFDPTSKKWTLLQQSNSLEVDPGYISIPQSIEFPTEGGKTAFGYYYPPTNKDYIAPKNEKPPLLVKSHGGPTGSTSSGFSLRIQFWTSRGFAVMDVNYGGSTGYGREFRTRLNGRWGIVDVEDCANGAKYLAEQGLADGERLVITGGSAGGYTTLCALTFGDTFKAGASHYGIGDLEALALHTHKFESRYLDSMVGPYPEAKETYYARSPIHHTEKLSCPVIFFQGLDDKVVPPEQSESMFQTVKEKGLPTAYVRFAGEGHGFRQAENIKRALDAEFYFYARVFSFEPADKIEPVHIENL